MYLPLFLLLLLCLVSALEGVSVHSILRKPVSLVYFYAPGCHFCEKMESTIDYLSEVYNHNRDFQIIKVNGRKYQNLVLLFLVVSFPSTLLYDNTKKSVTRYDGVRLVELMEDFISESTNAKPDLSKTQSLVHAIVSPIDLRQLANDKPLMVVFVGLSSDWQDWYRSFHFYQDIARNNGNVSFGVAQINEVCSEILEHFRVSRSPSLVYLDGDDIGTLGTLDSNLKVSEASIEKFLDLRSSKLFGSWFTSAAQLHSHADTVDISTDVQLKLGMNIVNTKKGFDNDLESQYNILVNKISL